MYSFGKTPRARSMLFLQRALCGHCAGTVRALCGHCAGTAFYGTSAGFRLQIVSFVSDGAAAAAQPHVKLNIFEIELYQEQPLEHGEPSQPLERRDPATSEKNRVSIEATLGTASRAQSPKQNRNVHS